MNYDEIELKLRVSLESAIEKGWAPKPVVPIGRYGSCCVLGSFSVDEAQYDGEGCIQILGDYASRAADMLGIEYADITWIWRGFDSRVDVTPVDAHHRRLYAIGARIHFDYCEWTNE